jgi:hypothetical protein
MQPRFLRNEQLLSDQDDKALAFLNILVNNMACWDWIDLDATIARAIYHVQQNCPASLQQEDPSLLAYQHEQCQALKYAGLDIYGGLEQLNKTARESENAMTGFPTAVLRVVDPEKARKFVKIGIQIGTDIPEHPSTLSEAADAYVKISSLVNKEEERQDGPRGVDASSTAWLLERQKYRVAMEKKYRRILFDIAREEALEEEVRNASI